VFDRITTQNYNLAVLCGETAKSFCQKQKDSHENYFSEKKLIGLVDKNLLGGKMTLKERGNHLYRHETNVSDNEEHGRQHHRHTNVLIDI